ncbi:MAG: DUF4136 domain-containing protein [Alphaproteobacteria bacterium]|nr:MAG: DUF4136 domain-containing protein [Alphaproteobacteria bacterium]
MKLSKTVGIALLAASCALNACASTYQPRISSIDTAAVQQAASVAFINDAPLIQSRPDFPEFPSQRADRLVREAIQANLESKGYRFAPGVAGHDLLIGYSIGTREESDQYVEYYRSRFGRAFLVTSEIDSYVEGSLVIDLIDARSGDIVWSGWASRNFRSNPGDRLEGIVEDAVGAILGKLPQK